MKALPFLFLQVFFLSNAYAQEPCRVDRKLDAALETLLPHIKSNTLGTDQIAERLLPLSDAPNTHVYVGSSAQVESWTRQIDATYRHLENSLCYKNQYPLSADGSQQLVVYSRRFASMRLGTDGVLDVLTYFSSQQVPLTLFVQTEYEIHEHVLRERSLFLPFSIGSLKQVQLTADMGHGPEVLATLRFNPIHSPATITDPKSELDLYRQNNMRAIPLRSNTRLQQIARAHASQVIHGSVTHDTGQGNPEERLTTAHLRADSVGETVACASDLSAAWLATLQSPAHQSALLQKYTDVGIGVAQLESRTCLVILLAQFPQYIP